MLLRWTDTLENRHCVGTYHYSINLWRILHARHFLNTLRPRQDDRHSAKIFRCLFLKENIPISIDISVNFAPKCQMNNIPTRVQIMAWRLPGDKPLSETMMVILLTHKCVTQPQWVEHTIALFWIAVVKYVHDTIIRVVLSALHMYIGRENHINMSCTLM